MATVMGKIIQSLLSNSTHSVEVLFKWDTLVTSEVKHGINCGFLSPLSLSFSLSLSAAYTRRRQVLESSIGLRRSPMSRATPLSSSMSQSQRQRTGCLPSLLCHKEGRRGSVEVRFSFSLLSLSLSVLFSAISLSFSLLPSPPSSLTPPVSREGEWIFSSDSGLKGLAEQSCYHRLVVVTMHLGHQYGDLHQVKHEVTGSALAMLQSGVPSNIKVRKKPCMWFFL